MLLGIDSGQTTLKVMVVDDDGRTVAGTHRPTVVTHPSAHHVERDGDLVVDQLLDAIAEAVRSLAGGGAAIDGIGLAAHGDGAYLVGEDGRPTRPAILALDTRAEGVLEQWRNDGSIDRARAHTGQEPFAASLAPLLSWLLRHEPTTLERTRWALSCKDWLRLALTGEVATDRTEASSSLGTLDGTGYSLEAMRALGLDGLERLLPEPRRATDVAGGVLPAIAERTGLRVGTPVVVGTHDVVAAALGSGATHVGDYSMHAGTYSVNQCIAAERVVDRRWQARPWIEGDLWVLMGASPASATNFEWFCRTLMGDVADPIGVANAEVAALPPDARAPMYHPYLFGSPLGGVASGAFLGLRGWHTRAHLVRGVWEGVVHNHRIHMDWLRDAAGPRDTVSLAGGAARSEGWSQLFADALDARVTTTATSEPGALGAAMLAAIGIGRFTGAAEAREAWVRVDREHLPGAAAVRRLDADHERFIASIELARPIWDLLEAEVR